MNCFYIYRFTQYNLCATMTTLNREVVFPMANITQGRSSAGQPGSIRAILAPLAAMIVGMFMVVLDNTAMNVMMHQLIHDFSSSYNTVQWAITGYSLAQSAVIPLAGWLSDRFGAKRVFLTSVMLFTIGSLLCAFASSIEELVTFRIIQGLGGGMVIPIAWAYTFRLSPPDKVGRVLSFMSIPIMLAPALGPVVSGWMVDYISWHWIFMINVPIGIVGVWMGSRSLPNMPRQSVAALDWKGMVLAPLAFASLSYGISEGSSNWGSHETIGGLLVGAIALILFVVTELRHANPLLELRVFKSATFTRGIIVLWITQFSFFGTIFLIPQYLQNVRGFSAFQAGLCLLPYALAAAVFMQISGRLFDRFGARWLAIIGVGLLAVAGLVFSQVSANAELGILLIPIALIGASMGLCMMPLNSHVLKSAPPHLVGRVSSLTSAMQQVMTSLSVAGLATVLSSRMKSYGHSGVSSSVSIWSHSFSDTFMVIMTLAVVGALLGFLVRRLEIDANRSIETVAMME